VNAVSAEASHSISSEVATIIRSMSSEEIKSWLSSPLSSKIAYDASTSNEEVQHERRDINLNNTTSDLSFLMPFAFGVTQQYMDAVRHLALSRCVMVAGLCNIFGIDEFNNAVRTMFHFTSLVWAYTQNVPTSYGTRNVSKITTNIIFSPAKKSRVDEPIGNQGQEIRNLLETRLMEISESATNVTNSSESLIGFIVTLAQTCVQSTLETSLPIPNFFEESPNKSSLSLRLLAPYVSFPSAPTSSYETSTRNRYIADCILSEIDILAMSNVLNPRTASRLLKHASTLLLKDAVDITTSKDEMDLFFTTLRSIPDNWTSLRSASPDSYHDEAITNILATILRPFSASAHEDEIMYLSKMESLKKMLLPWVVASQSEKVDALSMILRSVSDTIRGPSKVISDSILAMLHISNLMNRFVFIEKHSKSILNPKIKSLYAETLLSAISDVIMAMQLYLTPEMCSYMAEYATFWSSAFLHAVNGHRWNDALKACLSNPLKERRVNNYRRLVLAMVESGALNQLIHHILFPVIDCQSSIKNGKDVDTLLDLYELAVETLTDAASSRIGQVIPPHSSDVNYMGCLFTLHAAHNEWRRCCQTMDFYGIIAQGHVIVDENPSLSDDEVKDLDKKVVDDLILSSVSSSQLIQLVPDPSRRYIVSGELSPHPTPPPYRDLCVDNQFKNRLTYKRGHGDSPISEQDSNGEESKKSTYSRLSRLLTEQDLASRAVRRMALRTLYLDSLSPEFLKDIFQASDRQLIEALSRLGYLHHVTAVAYCKRDDKQCARPGGRDILVDAISHMVSNYLLPGANKLSRCPLAGEETFEEDDGDGIKNRPTLNQLRMLLGDGRLPSDYEKWREDSRNDEIYRGSMAMRVVQMYTTAYSGSDHSLASEVAQTLLDLDAGRAELPNWLQELLIGSKQSDMSRGLFANMKTGDPAALVRLYMKHGLLVHACKVICDVLSGDGKEREAKATSRLPEKGSIDYVPYDTIDELWNMIEASLQSANFDTETKNLMLDSRQKMEDAIKKHFELMKASEMGTLSARALNAQ